VSSEEKQLLFGEYAAGRISAADKRRLMAAALEDQELFDAIAEQEELSELTVSLPPRRRIWPLVMTAAATGAVTLGLFLMLRPKPEPVIEMAKTVPPPAPVAAPAPAPAPASAPVPVPVPAPEPAAPPVMMEEPRAKKVEAAAEVATLAAPAAPYQVLRRDPEGPAEMVDGEALLVRYRAEQAGRIALVNVASGEELAVATAAAGQQVDLPFTAVRGAMNLEIRRVCGGGVGRGEGGGPGGVAVGSGAPSGGGTRGSRSRAGTAANFFDDSLKGFRFWRDFSSARRTSQ
jgi:hypothetical protein